MAIHKPEWFKMDPSKFLQDSIVESMSTLELGACFRLLCRQWIDGFIPDDERIIARLCRLEATGMGEAWVTLCQFFPVLEPGKRANRFMWLEREKVVTELERKSDEGTKAARKRWDEHRKKMSVSPIGSPMADPMQDQTRADQTRAENTFPQTAFADHRKESSGVKTPRPTEAQVERLYSLYPRKRGKLVAKKAIQKAVSVVMAGDADHPAMPIDESLDYLARRVTLYSERVRGLDQQFVPHPATWFSAGSFWDDERDWGEKQQKSNGAMPLPAEYVPASEKIRQERVGGMQ